jgi:hypothetical protein
MISLFISFVVNRTPYCGLFSPLTIINYLFNRTTSIGMYFALFCKKGLKSDLQRRFLAIFWRFHIFKLSFCELTLHPKICAMDPKEKNAIQAENSNQQIFVSSTDATDFNSLAIKQEMEKVQQEVKAVLDSAIIDTSKLSLTFTV